MFTLVYFNGYTTVEQNYNNYADAKKEFLKIYNSYDTTPDNYITLEVYNNKNVLLCYWYPNGY